MAYMDTANGNRISVMRFDGTSWIQVGAHGFSAGKIRDISLAVDKSPYLMQLMRINPA
ncbi:MAG: hypothetical protein ACL93V_05630 [Candidatus Electrothrix sp. YB6]